MFVLFVLKLKLRTNPLAGQGCEQLRAEFLTKQSKRANICLILKE